MTVSDRYEATIKEVDKATKHLQYYVAAKKNSIETFSTDVVLEELQEYKSEHSALLTPEMKQIIERWGNPDRSPDNYVFPFLDGYNTPMEQKKRVQDITRRINKHLRIIGNKLGISGVSTYTARHSYATVLKRSGANISYISESLGHSNLKTTENYLASFEKEERIKNASFLTNFGND